MSIENADVITSALNELNDFRLEDSSPNKVLCTSSSNSIGVGVGAVEKDTGRRRGGRLILIGGGFRWGINRIRSGFRLWRRALIWVFWAFIYAWLWVIGRTSVRFMVQFADIIWTRWPWRGTRQWLYSTFEGISRALFPGLGRHYFSIIDGKTNVRKYSGCGIRNGGRTADSIYPLHSVSLNGCAWMLPYHIGVVSVLIKEKIVDSETKWLGSSGGSLIATAACLNLDLEHQLKFCVRTGAYSRSIHALGPCGFMSAYIGPHIFKSLPSDAAEKATGKLFVSITEAPGKNGEMSANALISEFSSRKRVHQALMASSYIPLYYETPALPGGIFGPFRFDGGFSENQPILDPRHTTTVSPIPFASDISPTKMACPNIEHLFPKGADSAMAVYESGVSVAKKYVKKLKDVQAKLNADRKRRRRSNAKGSPKSKSQS